MSDETQNDPTDPTWKTHMETLTKRMRMIEVSNKINEAIWEWYSERGLDVPNWKMKKDPQWWIDYLEELNNDDTL